MLCSHSCFQPHSRKGQPLVRQREGEQQAQGDSVCSSQQHPFSLHLGLKFRASWFCDSMKSRGVCSSFHCSRADTVTELVLAVPPPAAPHGTRSLWGSSTAEAKGSEWGGLCQRAPNLMVEPLVQHMVLIKSSLSPHHLSYHLEQPDSRNNSANLRARCQSHMKSGNAQVILLPTHRSCSPREQIDVLQPPQVSQTPCMMYFQIKATMLPTDPT